MDKVSYLGGADVSTIDKLYSAYKKDPENVEEGWRKFFEGFDFAQTNYEEGEIPENFQKEFKVINLIEGYRKRGHLFTRTNPVRERRTYSPTLAIENFDLSEEDLSTVFQAGARIGIGPASLKDIVAHLEKAYCESIGSEYDYIENPKRKKWFQDKLELYNRPQFSKEDKKVLFQKLSEATLFEQYLQRKYVGQKRFSVEGSEALIAGLHQIVNRSTDLGVEEFVFGMSHRGRLNTLVNIFDKDLTELFGEFEGKEFDDDIHFDGDVKYHLGLARNIKIKDKKLRLTLSPNPSHLESVDTVVEGITRSKIDGYLHSTSKIVPILIHGDAAIAGQGVAYETIQMAELDGYTVGGTIHIVVNNQVGFTTNYLDGRSSTYCTDLAKVTKCPVFHVNGDDVEAVAQTFLIGLEYRQEFGRDIFIDLLSYRKYGHNEGDEPKFTQPKLYTQIANHPNPREIYKKQLIEEGIIDEDYAVKVKEDLNARLDEGFEAAKKEDKVEVANFVDDLWKGLKRATDKDFEKEVNTQFDKKELLQLAEKVNSLPEGKKIFRKIKRLFNQRNKMVEENRLDWGMAEILAYATILAEGNPIRFSGQDCERGTFSHRHAVLTTEDNEEEIIPLNLLKKDQAKIEIYNSPLNEYGTLGYEYGYSLAQPDALTIWEAQFGDFANGAQIMIDQYISAAEDKWNVQSGLILLLPHGYEGQGAEHSSARMERYLQSCGDLNMQIINPTTPANNYHAFRRQLKRRFRKPLIVFSPKVLLRHPKAVSSVDDLAKGSFQEVIDDPRNIHKTATSVVLCSGKVYYEFTEEAEKRGVKEEMAFVRVEQLYPLPRKQIDDILRKYKKVENIIWGQEEPENMGAWTFIAMHMRDLDLKCVSRRRSASPAAGAKEIYLRRLKKLNDDLFKYAAVIAE